LKPRRRRAPHEADGVVGELVGEILWGSVGDLNTINELVLPYGVWQRVRVCFAAGMGGGREMSEHAPSG